MYVRNDGLLEGYKLTDKEKAFCHEYLDDFNAAQAAIRAGYSERSAKQIGHENLTKPYLNEYIKELTKDYLKDFEKRKLRLIKELESIAYSEGNIKTDNDGNITGKDVRDKLKGLELLGKTMALFSDKLDITGDVNFSINVKKASDKE